MVDPATENSKLSAAISHPFPAYISSPLMEKSIHPSPMYGDWVFLKSRVKMSQEFCPLTMVGKANGNM